jgi:hypothetical protein
MGIYRCPGSMGLSGTPNIIEKICPECGREIEIFSNEAFAKCECGFIAYNDTQNCIQWCKYAKECVGEDVYNRFMNK